jgi:hypothetical protein
MRSSHKNKDYDFFISEDDFDSKLKELRNYGSVSNTPYGAPRWFPEIATFMQI